MALISGTVHRCRAVKGSKLSWRNREAHWLRRIQVVDATDVGHVLLDAGWHLRWCRKGKAIGRCGSAVHGSAVLIDGGVERVLDLGNCCFSQDGESIFSDKGDRHSLGGEVVLHLLKAGRAHAKARANFVRSEEVPVVRALRVRNGVDKRLKSNCVSKRQ